MCSRSKEQIPRLFWGLIWEISFFSKVVRYCKRGKLLQDNKRWLKVWFPLWYLQIFDDICLRSQVVAGLLISGMTDGGTAGTVGMLWECCGATPLVPRPTWCPKSPSALSSTLPSEGKPLDGDLARAIRRSPPLRRLETGSPAELADRCC